jgi:hypothetical protein
MPDERLDSIQQGIHAPPESPSGVAADRRRAEKVAQEPPIEAALGGTSDAETAGQEADMNTKRRAAEEREGVDL